MSTNRTDWLKYELYPSLFNSIDTVFNEHNFTRFPGGWKSNTYLDGRKHKDRKDKTVISKQAPGRIFEQGGDNLSLVDYVMKYKGIDFDTACRTLAQAVNMELPKGDLSEGDYTKYKDRLNVLEASNDYFIYCLENSPGAKEVREYLKGRGYSEQDVKDMGLGFIPSQEQLKKKLKDKFTEAQIEEALQLNKGSKAIGTTHRLTIPFRSGGTLKGFKFRTIGEHQPKYLNTTGLDKIGGFFNLSGLKGDKDIKIVEGELDSLHATVKGVENVVALGGDSINAEQIKNAKKLGAKSFTICLDTEPGKELQTIAKVKKVVEALLEEGIKRIYVATLPDLGGGKTDPDRLIKEQGVGALIEAIDKKAEAFYNYYFHSYIEHTEDKNSPKQTAQLLEEIVSIGAKITEPLDKGHFITYVTNIPDLKAWGVTEEALGETIKEVEYNKSREKQKGKIKELLSKVNKELIKGDQEKALELLEEVRDIKLIDKEANYSKLLLSTTEEEIKEEEQSLPGGLDTGFKINGEDLLLPGGAITVYAGPTNHGKTTLLINTALNVATLNEDKVFIFFTYEERATAITQYFLNTYINENLNKGAKSNRRLLKEYFKTGSTKYITGSVLNTFESKKRDFFKTLIEPGRLLIKYIDYDTEELCNAIRYIQKEKPNVGGIFIDYFQLLNLPGRTKRQEELKDICIALKDVANKTGLPICLGAQFNREVGNLLEIHPTKIGEAGDIERIVNTLVALWDISKPNVKGKTSKEDDNTIFIRTKGAETGMYIELLKSRELPTGAYEVLEYNGNTGKLKNKAEDSNTTVKDIF